MKADRKFGSGDGGGEGPDDLRTVLQHWKAPEPPLQVEEQLRQAFRRARSRRRRLVWLAIAASLAVATGLALLRDNSTETPGRVAERPPALSPAAPSAPLEAPRQVVSREPSEASPASPKRVRPRQPVPAEVIVEPGQAELLLELARQLNGTRQAAPGSSLPRIVAVPADAVPGPIQNAQAEDRVLAHRDEWKKVESQWPFIHWSL